MYYTEKCDKELRSRIQQSYETFRERTSSKYIYNINNKCVNRNETEIVI